MPDPCQIERGTKGDSRSATACRLTELTWRGRTGNITNDALLKLLEAYHDAIVTALGDADFAELGADALVVHRRRDDTAQ